jgi:predicted transcriptional regulator
MSTLSPKQIEFIEQRFPAEAWTVFAQAQRQALALGRTVLVSKDESIYRLSPGGSMVFVKKIKPLVKVQRGAKLDLS